ncbi:MAG: hypothetical protein AB7N76_12895 [Planctomycetota bacterium]
MIRSTLLALTLLLTCASTGLAAPRAPEPAPPNDAEVAALLGRLAGEWELEIPWKAYWIGYTRDMRRLASADARAIPGLLALARHGASRHTRSGALLTLHCMGIRGRQIGRLIEGFRYAPARGALLELLSEPELQVEVLALLIRDPWASDAPRLLTLLRAGGPNDWAFVKALQRYRLADAPVHQPLPAALAARRLAIPGQEEPEQPEGPVRMHVNRIGSPDGDGSFKTARLLALRDVRGVAVEQALLDAPAWEHEGDGYGDPALGAVLEHLTGCDFMGLGDRLDYYLEGGRVHLCAIPTARARWLAWDARRRSAR